MPFKITTTPGLRVREHLNARDGYLINIPR